MKALQLYSPIFNTILNGFQEDLKVRNYSKSTSYNLPNHLKEFFHYLETKGLDSLKYLTTKKVSEYYQYLSTRKNQTQGGALSNGALNKHQQALKLFLKYLKNNNYKLNFGVHLKAEKANTIDIKDILTQDEMKELFEACNYSHCSRELRLRDKAILTVLYSCGLRRHEAEGLNIDDVLFDKRMLRITRGSKNKKRSISYVPINATNLKIIEDYLVYARPQKAKTDALFVNKFYTRMSGQTFENRLKSIIETTENEAILEKNITPHNLRHSIATHLLQNGMKLEKVSKFLGHSSLESTQVYTRIVEELANEC